MSFDILAVIFVAVLSLSIGANWLIARMALNQGVVLKRKFLFYTDTGDLLEKIRTTDDPGLKKNLSSILMLKIGLKLLQLIAVIVFLYYLFSV